MIQLGPPSHAQTSTYGPCSQTVVWRASCASAARRSWIDSTRRPEIATATASSSASTHLLMRCSLALLTLNTVKHCSLQNILELFIIVNTRIQLEVKYCLQSALDCVQEDAVALRPIPDCPKEHFGQRILVRCQTIK